jgi:hypothetical protein
VNEVGKACGTHERGEKIVQGLAGVKDQMRAVLIHSILTAYLN